MESPETTALWDALNRGDLRELAEMLNMLNTHPRLTWPEIEHNEEGQDAT